MISKSSVYVVLAFTVLGLVVSGLIGALFPHDYGTPETPFGTLSSSTPPSSPAVRTAEPTQVPRVLQLAPQAAPLEAAQQSASVPPRDVMVTPSAPAFRPVEDAHPLKTAAAPSRVVSAPTADAAVPPLPPTVVASNAPIVSLAAVASPVIADRTEAAAPPRKEPAEASNGAIDINKAPVEVLNHLPGMGMIGRTIVRHRPYRSIQDLVDKRVLRLSAFQKLRSRIKVD